MMKSFQQFLCFQNYSFFPSYLKDSNELFYSCFYNYSFLVNHFMKNKEKEIKEQMIFWIKKFFFDEIPNFKYINTSLQEAAKQNKHEIVYYLLSKSEEIKDEYFKENKSIINFVVPPSIKTIGNDSLFKCSSLIKVSLPSSITMIGKGAFSGCLSLREIEIPSSVISIGDHAFDGCSKLVKIKIPSSSLPVRRSRTWCCALPPGWWSWQASGRCYSRPLSWRKWRSRSSSIGGVFPAEKLLPRALSSLLHVCLESGWSSMMRPFCSLRSHSPQGPWFWWPCTMLYIMKEIK